MGKKQGKKLKRYIFGIYFFQSIVSCLSDIMNSVYIAQHLNIHFVFHHRHYTISLMQAKTTEKYYKSPKCLTILLNWIVGDTSTLKYKDKAG